jgi:transcriptional regulator with XRE-family HTH domain
MGSHVASRFTTAAVVSRLPHLGPRLRRLRHLQGLKQSVLAEWAGVTQATVSRWEAGQLELQPEHAEKLLDQLLARTDGRADAPLRRLIETSPLSVHLIADADHRLLAASPPREREWRQTAASLMGCSLWRYATEGIQAAEAALHPHGWWQDPLPAPVEVHTGSGNTGLEIKAGLMLWERLYLGDGTPVRLCTTLAFA